MEVAKSQDAIPFDISNIELGEHRLECTFDAIIEKYNLTDPAQRLQAGAGMIVLDIPAKIRSSAAAIVPAHPTGPPEPNPNFNCASAAGT